MRMLATALLLGSLAGRLGAGSGTGQGGTGGSGFASGDPGVYVAINDHVDGTGRMYASAYKNGRMQRLPSGWGSHAMSVFVSGQDVYVAGDATEKENGKSVATLWKNGVAPKVGGADSWAGSVYVQGGDVYVAVAESGDTVGKLWKNGTAQTLRYEPNFDLEPWAVFISGADVYVAGTVKNRKTGSHSAVVWKNGQATVLGSGHAYGLYVSGQDVYVVGSHDRSDDTTKCWNNGSARCWKNGVELPLKGNEISSSARAVFVSGNDVYVAGMRKQNETAFGNIVTLWKNGAAQNLTDGRYLGFANSVVVSEGDVYVTGFDNVKNVLWKNGQRRDLPGKAGGAHGIFVVPGAQDVADISANVDTAGSGSQTASSSGGGGSGSGNGDVVKDTAGDMAGSAGNAAKDATQSNINQGIREGVNSIFNSIFGR
jgi:hypothetical protein